MEFEPAQEQTCENTDRELWREREGDYYADSIHVTQGGGIGINCGGSVFVKPLKAWWQMAMDKSGVGIESGPETRQAIQPKPAQEWNPDEKPSDVINISNAGWQQIAKAHNAALAAERQKREKSDKFREKLRSRFWKLEQQLAAEREKRKREMADYETLCADLQKQLDAEQENTEAVRHILRHESQKLGDAEAQLAALVDALKKVRELNLVSTTKPKPAQEKNADGSLKHVDKEGSREHVIWYDNHGSHCSEPDCEINRMMPKEDK